MGERVLVVDDEENLRLVLETLLRKHGYSVEVAGSGEEALERVDRFSPAFVLADVRMPGMSGLDLCRTLASRGSEVTVIVMSAYGSIDLALEAMKAGAYDYISKPFKHDEILLVLKKATEREGLRRENRALRAAARGGESLHTLVAKSPAMRDVIRTLEKAADYKTTVLITGESGSGKELVARELHRLSPRCEAPFVAVHCGAIPESLLESELFGHRRGAFTDAVSDKRGMFEAASGGTLFLDEVFELDAAVQAKLLRVLQDGSVRRLGDTDPRAVDVRVVASSAHDLESEVAAGHFREDLFYRLNVLSVGLPPLRARTEDLPLLVDVLLERIARRLGRETRTVDEKATRRLFEYSWPGNVRELENVLEQATILAEGSQITERDLPDVVSRDSPFCPQESESLSIKQAVRRVERGLIERALQETEGNRTAAARLLEISHRALLYKIKDYGL